MYNMWTIVALEIFIFANVSRLQAADYFVFQITCENPRVNICPVYNTETISKLCFCVLAMGSFMHNTQLVYANPLTHASDIINDV